MRYAEETPFFDDDSIRAYGSYLIRVCGLTSKLDVDLYKYNPCDFLEIRHFMDDVDLAISNHGSELVIPYNGSSRWFCQNVRMGRFFEWKNYAGTGQSAWGWLGGWFGNDTPEVYVWFEDRNGWGRGVCDKFGRPDDESLSIRYDDYDKSLFVWMTKEDKDIPSFFNRVLSILKSPCDIRTIPPYPQMARIARNFRNKLLNELDVGSSVDSMR